MSKWTGHDYWVDNKKIDAALKGVKVGFAISDYYSLIYRVYIQYLNASTLKIIAELNSHLTLGIAFQLKKIIK